VLELEMYLLLEFITLGYTVMKRIYIHNCLQNLVISKQC